MALQNIKIEMKGTTSRWCTRAEAKRSSKKARRVADKRVVKEY